MLRKKGVETAIILLIFVLLLVTNILAAATEINIKTLPNKKIFIQYLKSGEIYTQIKSSTLKNTSNGEVLISGSFNENLIDLRLILRENSKEILNERINDIKTGEPVYISFVPGNIGIIEKPEPKNITVNQTNTTQPNLTATSPITNANISETKTNLSKKNASGFSRLTGFAVDFGSTINSKIPWKIILYSVIGIIVLVVVIFLFIFAKNKLKNRPFSATGSKVYFGPKPGSKPLLGASSSEERALRAAEEKIRLAQEEINMIRHRKDKIKEAERKLEQDKRELERLKSRF